MIHDSVEISYVFGIYTLSYCYEYGISYSNRYKIYKDVDRLCPQNEWESRKFEERIEFDISQDK